MSSMSSAGLLPSSEQNKRLVDSLVQSGILENRLAEVAMRAIDRGSFSADRYSAYVDKPHSIGWGQTISAPRVHALALNLLADHVSRPNAHVLDVGSGSGYLCACFAAILGEGGKVTGIDDRAELVEWSRQNLAKTSILADRETESTSAAEKEIVLGSSASCRTERELFGKLIDIRVGDGWKGVPEDAPFDAIHVGASPDELPEALTQQLKPGGRLVSPVGDSAQDVVVVDKHEDGSLEQRKLGLLGVHFVPLERESDRQNTFRASERAR